ncbi:PREDICTED: apoptotic chromatin condensation inducer in the nucleus-like isoform X2 [Acromyrmex echinatior]|uniref:apoptotic chromatin condensation inducer in the nucleus-like isoform X2 n=1 Tax=Acromyrmex echinatior TaxID=103372 RepID=UPI0005810BFB|nr:PREDICTED: apoptotic chromatin condensation inducer in the nucleus-like isoform X2 [Acromyrmex echinatior]
MEEKDCARISRPWKRPLIAEEKSMQRMYRRSGRERETERRSDRCPVDQNVMADNEAVAMSAPEIVDSSEAYQLPLASSSSFRHGRIRSKRGLLLVDERTAKKKEERARVDKEKKQERNEERERERKSEDGIGPVTNTQHRTPGCSFARWCEETIRHDVFLVSPSRLRRYIQCVLYIRRFCCSPDQ